MFSTAFWAGLGFLLFAVYLLKHAIVSRGLVDESQSWPTVQGEITYSEAVRYNATRPRWNFLANFVYVVEGKEYKSNEVALYTISSEEEAKALAERFPLGAKVPVYYDPKKPSRALLVLGAKDGKKNGEVIFAGIAVAFSLAVVVAAYLGLIGK